MNHYDYPINVGIFLFDGADTTDYIGPYEVFSAVDLGSDKTDGLKYNAFTVSETKNELRAMTGGIIRELMIKAEYDFSDCPEIDILVIPGGAMTEELLSNNHVLNWIKSKHEGTVITLSVCTGALLLARAGLLNGLTATTHHRAFEKLLAADPTITLDRNARFVDNGHIVTAAGVTSGYDAAMHVVLKTAGKEAVLKASEVLEYDDGWKNQQ